MSKWWPTKKDWDDGWKIIGRMAGVRGENSRSCVTRPALIGLIGIAGISLMVFGGAWFWVGIGWFVVFGILLGSMI
jgi:hypothetical protein